MEQCQCPLLQYNEEAELSASSEESKFTGPQNAYLEGKRASRFFVFVLRFFLLLLVIIWLRARARALDPEAWSPIRSDFSQYVQIDFGKVMNVTAVATRGRPFSESFVTAYIVEYGENPDKLSSYMDMENNVKVCVTKSYDAWTGIS